MSETPIATDLFVPQGPLSGGLKASIERAASVLIPDGQHGATFGVYDLEGRKISAGVVFKLGDHFRLAAETEYALSGDLSGTIAFTGTF